MRSRPVVASSILLILIASFMSLGVGSSSGISAQEAPRRRLIRLDAEILYVTGSLVYVRSGPWFVGGEAGLGLLAGFDGDFTRYIHAGALLTRVGSRSDLDFGWELGIGDLPACNRLSCLEARGYGAFGADVDYGWRRVRFGTRLFLGWMKGGGFLAWSPLFLRFRF